MAILVLSGTTVGRRVAEALHERGLEPISSLPAATGDELVTPGVVRVGGFGGAEGLAHWLRHHPVEAVVDATHPYARTMSRTAHAVCGRLDLPLLRVARRSWRSRADADQWLWADDHDTACRLAGRAGAPVFLAVGRQPLWHYHLLPQPVTARVPSRDKVVVPAGWSVVVDRGAQPLEVERRALRRHRTLVARDLGGDQHAAKLAVAAESGMRVVMLARPSLPGAQAASIDEVLAWVTAVRAGGDRRRPR